MNKVLKSKLMGEFVVWTRRIYLFFIPERISTLETFGNTHGLLLFPIGMKIISIFVRDRNENLCFVVICLRMPAVWYTP